MCCGDQLCVHLAHISSAVTDVPKEQAYAEAAAEPKAGVDSEEPSPMPQDPHPPTPCQQARVTELQEDLCICADCHGDHCKNVEATAPGLLSQHADPLPSKNFAPQADDENQLLGEVVETSSSDIFSRLLCLENR